MNLELFEESVGKYIDSLSKLNYYYIIAGTVVSTVQDEYHYD